MNADLTSIIIINYNTRHLTHTLLQSLGRHCACDETEIILVDNGSADGSAGFFRETYPEIKLIENKSNLGYGKAVNRAAKAAGGKYLWLLNSDCRLDRPILGRLIKTLESKSDSAAVTPKTVSPEGRFHSICRNYPTYRNILFSRGSLLSRIPFFSTYAGEYTLPDYDHVTRVDALAGTAMLVRREDFLALNGFDERFFLYFEDTDLCYRFSRIGKCCYYDPEAVIFHEFQGSSSSHPIKRLLSHHLSALEYFLKWYPRRWFSNLGLLFLLTLNLLLQIISIYAGVFRKRVS
jgi:N-acetylglucosaminyl-diphospho-decaprenol L-rhamnosyltransferase